MSRIAVVQRPPVLLGRERTLEAAVAAVAEAARGGAKLIAFPEAFVPGYPVWVWRLKPGADMALAGKLHALLPDNAVNLRRGDLDSSTRKTWRSTSRRPTTRARAGSAPCSTSPAKADAGSSAAVSPCRHRISPENFAERARLYPDPQEWINPGDSVVVAPWGKIEAGPLSRQTGILCAEVDAARCASARRSLDVAGHYARPDVFELLVNQRPRQPVAFD